MTAKLYTDSHFAKFNRNRISSPSFSSSTSKQLWLHTFLYYGILYFVYNILFLTTVAYARVCVGVILSKLFQPKLKISKNYEATATTLWTLINSSPSPTSHSSSHFQQFLHHLTLSRTTWTWLSGNYKQKLENEGIG